MPVTSVQGALDAIKNSNSTDGASVFDTLTKVLAKVLEDKPEDADSVLETVYLSGKHADALECATIPLASAPDAAKGIATASLFGYPVLAIDPESGEPIEPEAPADFECEDIVADGALFDALGVGLGRAEMHAVMLAARKLGGDGSKGISTVRFFGKFFGVQSNYYVFECTVNDAPEMPEAPEGAVPYEPGAGTNNFVYYVCSYLGGPFTQLPYVLPDQIKASRLIKKFLTGKLDSHVSTYPVFPGTEANYLRCQIARIACSTVCSPAGAFTADEEGAVEKNEEWEGVKEREASLPSNWSHRYPHLKMQGRCELFKREAPEDEEDTTFQWTEDEKEVGPPPLNTLDRDVLLYDGTSPSWTGISSSVQPGVKFQVGGVRSNVWPGAFCAAKGKHFTNVYVGWGQRNAPLTPLPPPALCEEFDASTLSEQTELPPKPAPPAAEGEEE